MPSVQVCCPNPACPGRVVEGESVTRETWEAMWHEARQEQSWGNDPQPGEWASDICCPRCGHEGIDPESGQLDSAEEELGERCPSCGVVNPPLSEMRYEACKYCHKRMPVEKPA